MTNGTIPSVSAAPDDDDPAASAATANDAASRIGSKDIEG
jgi:hypothetical protein